MTLPGATTAGSTDATSRPRIGVAWRPLTLAVLVIVAMAALSAYLTAPRPGGRMDAVATGPDGAHALVALLRDTGVVVTVADTIADVKRAVRSDTQVLIAETGRMDPDTLERLAAASADLLVVEPTPRARKTLAPGVRLTGGQALLLEPDCDLREAQRAGAIDVRLTESYSAGRRPAQSCYGGAVLRYRTKGRTVTVVGTSSFMVNSGLLRAGNAALAMNLAGARPRLVWFAPQRMTTGSTGAEALIGMLPNRVFWVTGQLLVVVLLAALWRGRRLGPLVAERLPAVVRASETVEGLGGLYRSRRVSGRAAAVLRSAALHRIAPRAGLGDISRDVSSSTVHSGTDPVAAIAQVSGVHPAEVCLVFFGPPPTSDTELVQLARAIDNIERQVTAT